MKRLTGVVIDAKVVHLLKDGNVVNDQHSVLNSINGVNTKVVGNRENQQAVKLFIKMVHSEMKKSSSVGSGQEEFRTGSDEGGQVKGMKKEGTMDFSLNAMKKHVSKKAKNNDRKMKQYIDIIRFYVYDQCCLCREQKWSMEADHVPCRPLRSKMMGKEGRVVARTVLSTIFESVESRMPQ